VTSPPGDFEGLSSIRSIYSSTRRDPLKQVTLLLSKWNQFSYAARPGALARRAARHTARRAARRRLLRITQARRAAHCSSPTTPPRAGLSSTTSPTPLVRVPRHVTRLVTALVVDYSASRRLVVDYSASRRLIIDYFAYAARPGASARRAAHHLSSTTLPTSRDRVPRHVARLVAWLFAPLVVDYFAYSTRQGASARRAARHAAHRRLLRVPRLRLAATLALLQPHRAW
jgi:hypothetical protein